MLTGLFDSNVTWSGFATPMRMPSSLLIQSIPCPLFMLQAEHTCKPIYVFIAYFADVVCQFQTMWVASDAVVTQLVQDFVISCLLATPKISILIIGVWSRKR